jgi:pimeloyl-ACP methyl ester carboxylesterase
MHSVRMIWLPGAFNTSRDFIAAGFAAAVQRRGLALQLTFFDPTFDHLHDRSALQRLRDESVLPARRAGEKVWLAGISLGGMLALDYTASHEKEIDGLYLMSPYLGNRALTREIAQAAGLAAWEAGELAESDEERRIWRYIKSRGTGAIPLHLGFGKQDRFASAQRLLAGTLAPAAVSEIDGGHDWRTWCALWDNFLDSRVYESVE